MSPRQETPFIAEHTSLVSVVGCELLQESYSQVRLERCRRGMLAVHSEVENHFNTRDENSIQNERRTTGVAATFHATEEVTFGTWLQQRRLEPFSQGQIKTTLFCLVVRFWYRTVEWRVHPPSVSHDGLPYASSSSFHLGQNKRSTTDNKKIQLLFGHP